MFQSPFLDSLPCPPNLERVHALVGGRACSLLPWGGHMRALLFNFSAALGSGPARTRIQHVFQVTGPRLTPRSAIWDPTAPADVPLAGPSPDAFKV